MDTFDYDALKRKVTFSERLRPGCREWIGGVVFFVGAAAFLVSGLRVVLPEYPATGIVTAVLAAVCVVLSVAAYISQGDSIKIQRFAAENDMQYVRRGGYYGQTGSLFRLGSRQSRLLLERLFVRRRRFNEIGNYRFQSGRNIRMFGYIRMKLPRHLPHMMLCKTFADNAHSSQLAGIAVPVDTTQRLSLEGDFNNYFTLYAPVNYERDALYIFTPDVMAAFTDHAHAYSAEIIDNNLYIYHEAPFDLSRPEQFEDILRVTSAIRGSLTNQSRRYADEKTGEPDRIAREGRRLRFHLWPVGIVFIVLAITLYAYQQIR